MNIIILGLNYAPEPVGIGPYTRGMAVSLAGAGHRVSVVTAKPYYPDWKINAAFAGDGAHYAHEDGVAVIRVPLYVPSKPTGRRRLQHHASFAARAAPALLAVARRQRPDLVIGIAPSLISLVAARAVARMFGAKLWIHIQDFEVEAAFATGLLRPRGALASLARAFEAWSLNAERVSTISPQMCAKLIARGFDPSHVVEFRNWAETDKVRPLGRPSIFRERWGIDSPHVALYSGNIANKQGIGIIVDAARQLAARRDLLFLICGNGPNRERLMEEAKGLDNVRFVDLQPPDLLPELLALASVHLLPQIAGAADLVLPSKLTNMLASGRPVVATAMPGTGLSDEVEGCGIVVPPGDPSAFAAGIELLLNDDALRDNLGRVSRHRAEERWSRNRILARFEAEVRLMSSTSQ